MRSDTPAQPRADVLLVDDTPANLRLLAGMLKEHGYKARPVPSGALALKAARNQPPDLILLDVNMPEMNGYEVCAALKEEPQLADIPVIFISALNETVDKVRAFEVGGVDYITKPFQFAEVEARVATHLQLRSLQRQLQQRNRQLEDSCDRMRELERMREGLTHMVVHDIRNLLTILDVCVGGLSTELRVRDDTVGIYLERASVTCAELIEMVSSMLDVARLEEDRLPLHPKPVDLAAMAQSVVDRHKLIDDAIHLSIGPSEALPLVSCDVGIIERVLSNLLVNAIKFTSADGRVTVGLRRRVRDVQITVTDTGCGIPEAYHERIFEKFGQVGLRDEHRKYSTGLGLTFCKLAVEAHGGTIGIDSKPGAGSAFWFRLPLDGA